VAISPTPGTKQADLQFYTDTNFTVSTSNTVGFWKIQKLIPLE